MRAFDPGARCAVLPKFFRRLMSAGGLQRLKVLACVQPDKALPRSGSVPLCVPEGQLVSSGREATFK
jgi:hypothetical protein